MVAVEAVLLELERPCGTSEALTRREAGGARERTVCTTTDARPGKIVESGGAIGRQRAADSWPGGVVDMGDRQGWVTDRYSGTWRTRASLPRRTPPLLR